MARMYNDNDCVGYGKGRIETSTEMTVLKM